MRSLTALFALALLPLAAPLAAQSSAPATVAQMHAAASHGDLGAARRAAEQIVRDGRNEPASVQALLFLAQVDHAQGRPLRAADALDRAAVQAAAFGDPVAQTRALIDAATIYVAEGRMAQAAERVERLRPLLHSPFLPAALRMEVAQRFHL